MNRRKGRVALPGRPWTALFLLALTGACATGSGAGGGGSWAELARPRPVPLEGALRISVSEIHVLAGTDWTGESSVSPALGLAELVVAGLLRRPDVQYVERRRFAEAVERERRGLPRASGAPRPGTSPGAELVLTGTWLRVGGDSTVVDLRLVDAQSGDTRTGWRTSAPAGADPASVARVITGSLLRQLGTMGRLPAWDDPLAGAAPPTFRAAEIPLPAVQAFLEGLAAEERFAWEEARIHYQRAMALGGGGFFEPSVALERVARLRTGGTLGAS